MPERNVTLSNLSAGNRGEQTAHNCYYNFARQHNDYMSTSYESWLVENDYILVNEKSLLSFQNTMHSLGIVMIVRQDLL